MPIERPVISLNHARIDVSHHQFEKELAHLERIIPRLAANTPLGLTYWRDRIAALEAVQASLPNGARRLTRLLIAFKRIENRSA
jgi:hypothetical protein